ncbi:protein RRP5 homolog [Polyodon spathula]|uniref:protein RRP5 homolog n=1 Tax=Polyodon spathula TaxID=7913 RepID=UPI001B7E4E11|nr:protein RRP5 homolog [Polyodon spathula]
MASSEEDFPRGGTFKKPGDGHAVKHSVEQDNLFVSHDPEQRKKRKTDKGGDEKKETKQNTKEEFLKLNAGKNVEILHFKKLTVGTLILGCVKEVKDFELVVGLPNGLTGYVQVTSISDGYTKLLNDQVDAGEAMEELLTLAHLYTPGMVVRCVVSTLGLTKEGHHSIKLSINPREVNKGLNAASLKPGMHISGCVASIEDHGFLIDIGIGRAKAFLPRQKALDDLKATEQGGDLQVGRYLNCLVEEVKSEGRIVRLSVNPNAVAKALADKEQGWTLSNLLPGLLVEAQIKKLTSHGITLEFLSSFSGSVDFMQMDPEKEKVYRLGLQVKACVLYVHPSSRTVGLSLLPCFLQPGSVVEPLTSARIGEVVEGCTVKAFHQDAGVTLLLPDGMLVFAHKNHLKETLEPLKTNKMGSGSSHTCRILDYSPMDQVALVSLRKSVIEAPFLRYQDILPGQHIGCIVISLERYGMQVKVTDHIRGLVPRTHLADILLKNPEKKYSPGDEIRCRVLTVIPDTKRLILTRKKALVESKLPLICSYEDARPGRVAHGYIVCVKDFGCIVRFFNEVSGLVPRHELSTEPVPFPEKIFYSGQVVKAKVLKCDPEQQKLLLSFKATGGSVAAEVAKVQQAQGKDTFHFETGKIVKVTVVRKTIDGLDVSILPEEASAFLPMTHLSDHVSNCRLLWEGLGEGDIISNVMCLSKNKEHIILCKKPIIKAAVEEGYPAKDFSEVQSGMMLPGFIKNIMPYGVFVEFPYGLMGLAPKSAMCDKFVTNTSDHFQVGQTVLAKVTNLDEGKRRFLLSLKVSECSSGEEWGQESLELLRQCLEERRDVCSMMTSRGDSEVAQNLSKLVLGQKLKLAVEEMKDDGTAYFKASQVAGATASATKHHLTGVSLDLGQNVTAVILYINHLTSQVHLSLRTELVNSKTKQLKENTTHSATVQHVEKDFAIASLAETGQLAIVPVAAHLNDTFWFESERLSVGQTLVVSVRELSCEAVGGLPLVVRGPGKAKRKQKVSESNEEAPRGIQHSCCLGDTVSGTVKSIHPTYVLLALERGVTGSIHASEILETVKPFSFPTSSLKMGMKITARVIGGREAKSHKFLPVTHSHFTFTIPELTVQPSKLKGDWSKEVKDQPLSEKLKSYQPGQEVTCFVSKFNSLKKCLEVEVTHDMRGAVELLAMTCKPKDLKRPEKLFKPGQALNALVVCSNSSKTRLCLSLSGVHSLGEGSLTLGTVTKITPHIGLVVSLPFRQSGRAGILDLSDTYTASPLDQFYVGQTVRCCVLAREDEKIHVSLRQSRTNPISNLKGSDPEILSIEDLKKGQIVRGYVKSVGDAGVFIGLSRTITGRSLYQHVTNYFVTDHSVYVKNIPLGKLLTCKVLSVDKKQNRVELSLLPEDTGEPDVLPESLRLPSREKGEQKEKRQGFKKMQQKRKRGASESEQEVAVENKKVTKRQKKSEDKDNGVEVYFREEEEPQKQKKPSVHSKSEAPPRLQVSAGFSWDVTLSSLQPVGMGGGAPASDSEEDEEVVKPQKKSKWEKNVEKQRQEKELSKVEGELMDPGRQPQTANDFNRLVLGSPDSSIIWLQYMAFHLHSTEIEQARAVAERALKTISFREEQEKLNVWVALLNLENMYGTEESLNKVFERAVQHYEPLKVFQSLADIYTKSDKYKQAESLYNTMLRRFRQERSVWLSCAAFYLRRGRTDETHRLLQRALKCLPDKEHVDLIVKFAQLEFRFGDAERAKSMFESTLGNYPRRTDLWSVYIDMMIKYGSQKEVRSILERVIHLSLAAKRIKFFFKRYLEYEKKHGSAESVQVVKEKAMEYVEAKGSSAES